jgi:hypothetical protein
MRSHIMLRRMFSDFMVKILLNKQTGRKQESGNASLFAIKPAGFLRSFIAF